jgi:hypothetical protein
MRIARQPRIVRQTRVDGPWINCAENANSQEHLPKVVTGSSKRQNLLRQDLGS